jgi:hypothetical protein
VALAASGALEENFCFKFKSHKHGTAKTDRCVCYTDGSGCDITAVLNVAS